MSNTLGSLIATLVRDSAVKSQVCKRRRLLNEVVVSKWEHEPLSPPPASSIHPCYILKAKDPSASPSPKAANIKTDSSIPDNRCSHLRAQSHCWLQRASIYSCEGWSGRGVTGGKVASGQQDELNSPLGLLNGSPATRCWWLLRKITASLTVAMNVPLRIIQSVGDVWVK